jgi:hypothetical protein
MQSRREYLRERDDIAEQLAEMTEERDALLRHNQQLQVEATLSAKQLQRHINQIARDTGIIERLKAKAASEAAAFAEQEAEWRRKFEEERDKATANQGLVAYWKAEKKRVREECSQLERKMAAQEAAHAKEQGNLQQSLDNSNSKVNAYCMSLPQPKQPLLADSEWQMAAYWTQRLINTEPKQQGEPAYRILPPLTDPALGGSIHNPHKTAMMHTPMVQKSSAEVTSQSRRQRQKVCNFVLQQQSSRCAGDKEAMVQQVAANAKSKQLVEVYREGFER